MIINNLFDSVLKGGKNFQVSFERTLRVPDDGEKSVKKLHKNKANQYYLVGINV